MHKGIEYFVNKVGIVKGLLTEKTAYTEFTAGRKYGRLLRQIYGRL